MSKVTQKDIEKAAHKGFQIAEEVMSAFGDKKKHPPAAASKDPFLGLKFWVEIDGIHVAGFSECSGFHIETEVMEYAEGGWNNYTHKLPVRTKYSNIVLKRGLDPGSDLYTWFVDTINGYNVKRKNITISIYKPNGDLAQSWAIREAYPVKWSCPDLRTDAGATAVESVEIAHSGLTLMPKRLG